jgi:hypothetical protein
MTRNSSVISSSEAFSGSLCSASITACLSVMREDYCARAFRARKRPWVSQGSRIQSVRLDPWGALPPHPNPLPRGGEGARHCVVVSSWPARRQWCALSGAPHHRDKRPKFGFFRVLRG